MEDLLQKLFKYAEDLNPYDTDITINPFFKLIVFRYTDLQELSVYNFKHEQITLDDNYSFIELEKPNIYGILDGKRIELIQEGLCLKKNHKKTFSFSNCLTMKDYNKVVILAKNSPCGSYAAGCPANNKGSKEECRWCERTQ